MASFIRRSILVKSVPACCLFLFVWLTTVPASAQRPAGRIGGPGVPTSVPAQAPIYRAPAYHSPIYQPPISRPSYFVPRSSAASPAHELGSIIFRPPFRPGRPRPPVLILNIFPVVNGPFSPFNWCWWVTCGQYWVSTFAYSGAFSDGWSPENYMAAPASPIPVYVYGREGPDIPQLFLNDGTILNVTDYWLVDGQLHFMLVEEEKPVEQVIPFDELDLQKTVDVNMKRGFRFMLRNEPFEQYVRDHPEGPPQELSPEPR